MILGKLVVAISVVVVCSTISPAQLWLRSNALKTFEGITEFKMRPKSNFTICRGTSRNSKTCEPFTGNFTKVKYVPYVVLDLKKGDAELDRQVEDQVIDRYLGAAYYLPKSGNGILHQSCLPANKKPSLEYKPVLFRSPVINTAISQLIEEEILREAKFKFKTVVEANNVAAKSKLEARFESELRNHIRGEGSNKADIKWVNVQLQADERVLRDSRYPQECFEFLRDRDGSLVTGIAGFVVMSSAGSSEYVSERIFKLAADAAFQIETNKAPTPTIQSAMAEASASWASSTNRKITTVMETRISQPTFYPIWIQFSTGTEAG